MGELPTPTEEDIDSVVAEFGGDMREAIRALMHDLAVLAADMSSVVSRGFVRGKVAVNVSRIPLQRPTGTDQG